MGRLAGVQVGVTRLDFYVPGHPQPAGSKRGFPVKRRDGSTGVAVVEDNPKARDWKAAVAQAGVDAMVDALRIDPDQEVILLDGPIGLTLVFTLARPRGHFGTGRNHQSLRAGAPVWPAKRPDTTKLIRAVEDALTGIVWRDDAQVVEQYAAKRYGAPEGVRVTLWTL